MRGALLPVGRGRPGVHDARDTERPGGLQNGERPAHIDLDERRRIGDGLRNGHARGEVDDGAASGHRLPDAHGIAYVADHEHAVEPREIRPRSGREVVEDRDAMTPPE